MAGFNLSGLTDYTKTNEEMLLLKSFFEPKTASVMQILTGVKSTIQLPTLDDALIWQDGSSCGFNASGDTTINARVLTVGRIKVNKQWCIQDLETKYTQLLLSPGSNYDALPGGIDEAFVNTILGTTRQDVETAIWQGNTASGNSQLKWFDGLIKIIGAATGPIDVNALPYITPVTAFTTANIISVFQAMYQAIPTALLDKEDFKIFVGNDVIRLYQLALTNANLFHYPTEPDPLGQMKLHGTDINIMPVPGLNGMNKIYGMRTSNMFLGTDIEGEEEEFRFWYSQDFDMVRFSEKFKYGVQVGRPNEILRFII